jgi:hypothetical protein
VSVNLGCDVISDALKSKHVLKVLKACLSTPYLAIVSFNLIGCDVISDALKNKHAL